MPRINLLDTPGLALFDTPLGTCALAWSARGIRRLQLPEASPAATRKRIASVLGAHAQRRAPPELRATMKKIASHLGGKPKSFDHVVVDLAGVGPFARAVYEELRRVGPGQTVTYGELAARVGRPGAARAVGQAMARNPVPLIVPCHRVLAAGGKPGGFSAYGGTVTKARMLQLEGVRFDNEQGLDSEQLFDGGSRLPFDAHEAQRHLRRADPILGALMRRVGPLRLALKKPRSTFEALAEAIVYQQLSGKAAATIYGRVRALFPRRRSLRAEDVAECSADRLRSAGLSRAKAAALADLARRTLDGEIPSLKRLARLEDEAIVRTLIQVRGIGRWTAEMLLIFQLGRPDVLPVDDYGVRKGYARVFRLKEVPTPKLLAAHGERWRPWRTVASWYLWRALELP